MSSNSSISDASSTGRSPTDKLSPAFFVSSTTGLAVPTNKNRHKQQRYRHKPLMKGSPRCMAFANSRSEEHTSELQSLMRISYAVFCLKKKKKKTQQTNTSTKHTQLNIHTELNT